MTVFVRVVFLFLTSFFSISAALAASSASPTNTQTPYMNVKRTVADTNGPLRPEESHNHFDILGAVGVATITTDTDNAKLGVTSSETDLLVQTSGNRWNSFEGQLGAGYVYYFGDAQPYSNQTQWFPSVEPELNVYHITNHNISGDVWRFSSPAFNQLTYTTSVQSTRLMLDAALTIVSRGPLSLYVIGGIGNAWNRMGYEDTDNEDSAPCDNQNLDLGSSTQSSFAWEAGGGFTYAFNDTVAISLQYLYTDLGKGHFSSEGNTGTITVPVIVAPDNFDLHSQAALLSIHIAV